MDTTEEARGARLADRVAHAAVTAWIVWVVNTSAAAVRGIGIAEQFTEHVAWWQYALFAGLVVIRPVAARSLTPVLVGPDRDLRPAGPAARLGSLLAVLAATVVAVGLLTLAVGVLTEGDRPARLLSAVGDHLTGVPSLVLAGATAAFAFLSPAVWPVVPLGRGRRERRR
ncbi:hypothetical protein PV689_23485 [Streptomyces sp. ATCC51928]|uniref:Integral membrane protein n=1 Tax=Streptomyces caviscabies TaxID=90079 RepID=A0ABW2MGK3_9ACTN|nr:MULTISPECIES: hypothetical protein [unclassified Streptomyces]MDX3504892.1 hypothetical protein [Streptomyces sp. ATCC51928]MDX5519213.1 hypothetical protein [Streptomyces sp. DE06-01C]